MWLFFVCYQLTEAYLHMPLWSLLPLTALGPNVLITKLCLRKLAVRLCFIPRFNVYHSSSCSRVLHAVAGPGFAVSSVIASRNAGTKLSCLVVILDFLQESPFQTPRDISQPCMGGYSKSQPVLACSGSAWASRVMRVSGRLGTSAVLLSRDGFWAMIVQKQELLQEMRIMTKDSNSLMLHRAGTKQ